MIAHRGASHDLPEHTPAAYRQALADRADGFECDVRLTADGHLVCVHDATVRRTSSGRGSVSSMTLAELERLDWGSWRTDLPQAVPHASDADRHRLLTLRELLDIAGSAGRPIDLAIETKHPNRFGGRVEEALAELLTQWSAPVKGTVRVMSFSALAVRRMHRLAPQLPLVYLLDRIPHRYRDGSLPGGARIAGIDIALLREHPDSVRRVHEAGHGVHVWTVDEPDDVRRCLDAGVQAIITNRPDMVRAMVDGPTRRDAPPGV